VTRRPYSLDLALSDLWLFGALKEHLKGNCVTCDEVQAAVVKWFQAEPDQFHTDGFKKPVCAHSTVLNKMETM
jgi:hypothetical protein